MKTDSAFLSMDQMASRLGVCRSSLYKLMEANALPSPVFVGKRRKWLVSVVDDWLETRKERA